MPDLALPCVFMIQPHLAWLCVYSEEPAGYEMFFFFFYESHKSKGKIKKQGEQNPTITTRAKQLGKQGQHGQHEQHGQQLQHA